MTLPAHRIETTIQPNGTLTLEHLPFPAGQPVEVIILARPGEGPPTNPYPLRGSVVRYDRPTEPVAQDDWEALK